METRTRQQVQKQDVISVYAWYYTSHLLEIVAAVLLLPYYWYV